MTAIDPHDATVLFVDDNAQNRMIIHDFLKHICGVRFVEGRQSGAHLFGLLAAHPKLKPHLILLDIEIPHEDGYAILKQIRSRPFLRETLVVAVTAFVSPIDVERARIVGFDGFIGKPLNIDRFPDQIKRILAGEKLWEPL